MIRGFLLYTFAVVWGVMIIAGMSYIWNVFRRMGKRDRKKYRDIFKED